jgi:hypothetical protein
MNDNNEGCVASSAGAFTPFKSCTVQVPETTTGVPIVQENSTTNTSFTLERLDEFPDPSVEVVETRLRPVIHSRPTAISTASTTGTATADLLDKKQPTDHAPPLDRFRLPAVVMVTYTHFQNDCRHCMRLIFFFAWCLIIAVGLAPLPSEFDVQFHQSSSKAFMIPVVFSLVVGIPVCAHLLMSARIFGMSIGESFRRCNVVVCLVPNVFLALNIFPDHVIALVLYCQFLTLFLVTIGQLFNFVTAEKIVPLYHFRNIFSLITLSLLCGFFYSLSCYEVVSGKAVFKALYLSFAFISQMALLYKMYFWLRNTRRFANVLQLGHGKQVFLATVGILASMVLIVLVQIIGYESNLIFFPESTRGFVVLEWFFFAVFLIMSILYHYQELQNQKATAVSSLFYHHWYFCCCYL